MVQALIDYLVPPTIVPKQKVWDNFDGDSLDERWTTRDFVASGVFAMNDEIDGGFQISTDPRGFSNDRSGIDFNNIRQYNFDGAVMQYVLETVAFTDMRVHTGLTGDATDPSGNVDNILLLSSTEISFLTLQTNNGSSSTFVASSDAGGTTPRAIKLDQRASSSLLFINDTLEALSTTNLPTVKLNPFFNVTVNGITGQSSINIRELEVYNT